MAADELSLLREAIARNRGAVLSLPTAGAVRHCKSRFLVDAGDTFWIESVPRETALIEQLIGESRPAGVAFKSGPVKIVFATLIERRESEYRVNENTSVDALLLRIPESLLTIQRRASYRVAVPQGWDITLRLWRIAEKAQLKDRPLSTHELSCELRDLSLGGMGVTLLGNKGQPPKVSVDDRLRVQLTMGKHSLLLEGRLRHPIGIAGQPRVRAGIQFKTVETDMESRQSMAKLTRIVGELQREEIRRQRLGLASAGA